MAGAAPADALHAGTDEPDVVGRDNAEGARHAGTLHTKDSASPSPSLRAHDDDDNSVASSTGTAGRRRKLQGRGTVASHQQHQQHHHHQQPQHHPQYQQQLRKSASVSTTDTTASAQTNASTEVRAAVSNRASRSALNQRPKSVASSPIIPQEPDHEPDDTPSASRHQDIGTSYRQNLTARPPVPSNAHRSHGLAAGGIVQVTPAPPPSPPPQHRGRTAMASSFLPNLFGRRRPTSSASSMTASSNFAASNPPPPGPQAFDFNAIMNSLEADDAARADIDAIAEICGHSRLSLANAHANHRGPVGELVGTSAAASQYSEGVANTGLEPVREAASPRGDETGRLGTSSGSQAGDERWQLGGGNEQNGDERSLARQAARGVSGIAYGRSASVEEEGRARRHLARGRDASEEGERNQRRWR